jgi:hypothetical protein
MKTFDSIVFESNMPSVEIWQITVVNMEGGTLQVGVLPTDIFERILAIVTTEWGKVGRMYADEINDKFQPAQIVQRSGLTKNQTIYFIAEDFLAAERNALVALRESTNFEGWDIQAGWGDLETFMEMEHLTKIHGVTFAFGCISRLSLHDCNLAGRIPLFHCN